MTISQFIRDAFIVLLITRCLACTCPVLGQTTSTVQPAPAPQQGEQGDTKPKSSDKAKEKKFDACPANEDELKKIFLDPDVQIGVPRPEISRLMGRTHMGLDWQRDFVAVVMDMMNGDLYWYDYMEPAGYRLVKMPKGREFFPAAYTKEKMLVVICNAHFNTSAGLTPTNISVSEATAEIAAAAAAAGAATPNVTAPPSGTDSKSAAAPAPAQAATPTPTPPSGGGRSHTLGLTPQPSQQQTLTALKIPGPSTPTDADTQKVVDAIEKYLASSADANQKIGSLQKQANDLQDQETKNEQPNADKIKSIEDKSTAALTENTKAADVYAVALDAGNGSVMFSDALTDAVTFVQDYYPTNGSQASAKLGTQVTKLSSDYTNAKFNTVISSLSDQYKAIFTAIDSYATSTADIKAIENVLKTTPLTAAQQEQLQNERNQRYTDNQKKVESAAISKVTPQHARITSIDKIEKPSTISDTAKTLSAAVNAVVDKQTALSKLIKQMVEQLDSDYVRSKVNIVIPVPNVSANSLQLFNLTVTDNYKPLVWTDPDKTARSQDGGSSCPSNCSAAPTGSNPSPAAKQASGMQPAGGVGLQVTALKPGAAATLTGSPVQVSEQADGTGNVVITASFIVPFHRIVNFAADGGFLYARVPSNTFSTETFPESIVTTTTTTSTSTAGVTTTTTTVVPTTSSTTFGFQNQKQSYQTAGILGVTWYPLGRDSFTVNSKAHFFDRPSTGTYSRHEFAQKLAPGILLATAVNTTGTFVVAPVWDIFTGVSVFGGLALADKTSLSQNVVLCNAQGTSVSTVQYGSTATPPPGSTVSSVQVQTTTGCANANATQLSGTTVPTVTGIAPGFGFGIVFNSSLFSLFAGKN